VEYPAFSLYNNGVNTDPHFPDIRECSPADAGFGVTPDTNSRDGHCAMKDQNQNVLAVAVGKRMKMIRVTKGISMEKMAEALECSIRTLEKVEHGDRMMKAWRQVRFCRICDISMDYLLRGIDNSDIEDIPVWVIEMYKEADSEELDILQKYMLGAEDEISKRRKLIEKYSLLLKKAGRPAEDEN